MSSKKTIEKIIALYYEGRIPPELLLQEAEKGYTYFTSNSNFFIKCSDVESYFENSAFFEIHTFPKVLSRYFKRKFK